MNKYISCCFQRYFQEAHVWERLDLELVREKYYEADCDPLTYVENMWIMLNNLENNLPEKTYIKVQSRKVREKKERTVSAEHYCTNKLTHKQRFNIKKDVSM